MNSRNRRHILRLVFLAASVQIFIDGSVSAQTITGVSGSLQNGQSVTITGSNFGTHGDFGRSETFINAAWNDFSVSLDDGNLARSQQVDTAVKWTVQTTGARPNPAGKYARKRYDLANIGDIGRLGSLEHVVSGSGARFYTSFWLKTGLNNLMTGGKFYRQYFDSFDYYITMGPGTTDEEGELTGFSSNPGSPSPTSIYGSALGSVFSPGETWRRIELLVCLNGCASIFGSNDYVEFRVNGVRVNRRGSGLPSNHISAEGSSSNEREGWVMGVSGEADGHTIDIGNMIDDGTENGGAGDVTLSHYDYSDVFIDYTFSRVMLSSASTCAAITSAEMQIPTAWGSNSITVKLNRGAYLSDASLYLYVFNDNNTCNANGFPVTLGSGAGTPAKVTNLQVLPGFAGLVPIFGFFRRRRALKQKLQ